MKIKMFVILLSLGTTIQNSYVVADSGMQATAIDSTQMEAKTDATVTSTVKAGYKPVKLKNANAAYLDKFISMSGKSEKMQACEDLLHAADDALRSVNLKSKSLDLQLKELVEKFDDFAEVVRKNASYIVPLIQESLESGKLKKLGIVLPQGSVLVDYAKSKVDTLTFFKGCIKTEKELAFLAVELHIFLSDFLKSCPKSMAQYNKLKKAT